MSTSSLTPKPTHAHVDEMRSSVERGHHHKPLLANEILSHSMPVDNLANPMKWPLHRKIYTSAAAWTSAAAVAFGITCFTAGKASFIEHFGLNPMEIPVKFIAGMSLYIFGIVFAPIYTPHISERVGRSIVYLVSLPLCGLFLLGAGLSPSVGSVLVCRFLAGFAGGPCLVLIEGTFADIWSAETTNTYYAVLGTAAYFGAGLGPLAGGYLIKATGDFRWTQYFSVILIAVVFLFGLGQSETYQREIPRRQAVLKGQTRRQAVLEQDPAQSGVTLSEMFRITVLDPIRQTFTEPIVMLSTLFLLFHFAVVFQWFITVPVALGGAPPAGPGYSIAQVGLAFLGAPVGASMAALTTIVIEQVTHSILRSKHILVATAIEHRLLPAMIGQFLMVAALFWVGFTVNPSFSPLVPIIGTAVYVYGNAMVIMSIIPYLFDAYRPAGTLAALTAAASARLLFAGALPLVILQFFTAAMPKWALGTFGFIAIAMLPIPFILFYYGPAWRGRSRYNRVPTETGMAMEPTTMAPHGQSHAYDNGA